MRLYKLHVRAERDQQRRVAVPQVVESEALRQPLKAWADLCPGTREIVEPRYRALHDGGRD